MLRQLVCVGFVLSLLVGCSQGEPKGSIDNKDKPVASTKKDEPEKTEK